MAKRVWILSELYYPEEAATGYILTNIAEAIASQYEVHVITGMPDYITKNRNAKRTESVNKVSIRRCRMPSFDKNNIISRIMRAVILSLLLSFSALKKIRRGDVVFMATNPATLLFFMVFVCSVKKVSFLILVHDVFPDNLTSAGILKPNSLVVKILTALANSAYRQAQKVICVGRDMAEIIRNKLGERANRVAVITNWADCEKIIPQMRHENVLIKELGLQNKFIIEFAGNIGRVQGIEYLVEAIKLVPLESIHFLFIGRGAKLNLLKEQIQKGMLKNTTLLDMRPRSDQQNFLNACDVGLISLAPGMYGLGVPSKAYNMMAAGKPIIAAVDPTSEIGLMIREDGIGWVVPPGDPAKLADAILEAKSAPLRLVEMGARARSVAVQKYSFTTIIARYSAMISKF